MSIWDLPLHVNYPLQNIHLPLFAGISASRVIGGVLLSMVLLGIVYLILKSVGIDASTPPSMIVRKFKVFFRSLYVPFIFDKKMQEAEDLEKSDVSGALDLYISLFDFDGMFSSNAKIAIQNDSILEQIEGICDRTGYEYPAERINRFREDMYDYFLVKQKYLSPVDYDGTPLHRPENEERFKHEINLSQERSLTEGFESFMETLLNKLRSHVKKDGVVLRPRGEKAPRVASDLPSENLSVDAPMSASFGDEIDAPFGAETSNPFAQGSMPEEQSAEAQDIPNPFAMDDPKDPFADTTGTIRKLPDVHPPQEDSNPFGSLGDSSPSPFSEQPEEASDDPFSQLISNKAETGNESPFGSNPGTAIPAPTNAPSPFGGGPATPPPAFPQPTGGFPGFGQAQAPAPQGGPAFPQPTGGFPGMTADAPTGGFPGMGTPTPAPQGGPAFPQPTGGFPGFSSPTPAPAPQGGPAFPQPTGGFPGFNAPTPPPQGGPAVPQPTGGFPGFGQAQPPAPQGGPGFPQPTGGFPGFGQAQPPAPQGGPGFPQPTGGFPGFGNQPPMANPFGDKKK